MEQTHQLNFIEFIGWMLATVELYSNNNNHTRSCIWDSRVYVPVPTQDSLAKSCLTPNTGRTTKYVPV